MRASRESSATDLPVVVTRVAVAVGLGLTMVGGLLVAFTDATGIPPNVGLVGMTLFVSGALAAGAVAARNSHTELAC